MKIIQLAFLIILASTLSGCAYNGYRQGYAGYSSGYGSTYSTGYGVQESYYYPPQPYYPQGGGIHYRQRYGNPGYSNRPPLHGGHNHHRDWRNAKPHHYHQNPGVNSKQARRWQNHSSRHDGQPQNHAWKQERRAQAKSRQNTAAPNRSWQSPPTSGRIGSFQRSPDSINRRNYGQR